MSFLELLKDILEFLNENWNIIKQYPFQFAIWTLLVGLCMLIIFSIWSTKYKKTIEKKDAELEQLHKAFEDLNAASWLGVSKMSPDGNAAESISKSLHKKKK